jgi:hypothetical protein
MSAFGGKADMPFCTAHVCFSPKADIPDRTYFVYNGALSASVLFRDDINYLSGSRIDEQDFIIRYLYELEIS